MRCCSMVVGPGRAPLSRSPWRTHLRSVSAVQPILLAIDSIAAHCDGYWSLASKTMRTARSTTSGENFGDFLMSAPFSIEGASSKSGAVHGLQPHRLERHMVSNDPDFETKAADVIALYLNPPAHAAVFCVDEKTAIQALD